MASTYALLQAEIANWANRSDLTSEIQSCIAFAEARFNRALWAAEREESTTLTATSAEVALPTDYTAMRSLHIVGDPLTIIEPMSLHELRAAHTASATGLPANYAITGGATLVLAPAPDMTYDIVLNYYRTIPALSDTATTNWLLTSHPDLYLAASLVEVYLLLKDEQRAGLWSGKSGNIMAEITSAGRRKAHSGPPSRIRGVNVV